MFLISESSRILIVVSLLHFVLTGSLCEFIHETNFADKNFKLSNEVLDDNYLSKHDGEGRSTFTNSLDSVEDLERALSYSELMKDLNEDDEINDYLEVSSRNKRENTLVKKRRHYDEDIDGSESALYKRGGDNAVLGNSNDEFGHDGKKSSRRHAMAVNAGGVQRPMMKSGDESPNRMVHHNHGGPIKHTPNFKHNSNWESSSGNVMKQTESSLFGTSNRDVQSCHPATSRPKVTTHPQPTDNNDKHSKEYEDMLKGKVAERLVAVIQAKVCKSPKLAQFFGNCQGGTPAKDNGWEAECNPLFKPETVKEIMTQMENINTSETCHKLPPKLYEFLEWLIKVKPTRNSAPRKQRGFCDQYTDCAKGDSSFLFRAFDQEMGHPNENSDRYRRNSYLYQQDNDFYADDDGTSAQLIDSLSQTLTQLDVIEDTDSQKQTKSTRSNENAIASLESDGDERTIYLESIPRSERSLTADAVRNESVGFDSALAEGVPVSEEDE
ncbi:uncharacterized protein LOC111064232 isoform X2 [Nilaparvata lugens]|uniref:uncharacterized protein LOC111064232 isoform X2 n=1 Tax=Nilaparvata lugens TaxID=108931 RepID=UPI00193E32A4|nr:uncharacterized protein LOC111064232 isoform X2 [Nilaparvata lugens]XP_039299477.1 uncharacterized protein LOC111064232 isoform X2 [Nilaparvata lugens]